MEEEIGHWGLERAFVLPGYEKISKRRGGGGVKVETEGEFSLWVSVTAWAAITCLHPTVVISLAIMATHDVSQSHSQMCVGGIWNKFDKSDFVFVVCFEKFSVSYLVGF